MLGLEMLYLGKTIVTSNNYIMDALVHKIFYL
jgi:hypothetical protein